MAIKKNTTENNEFIYPHKTLESFAKIIVNEYKGDYDQFLLEKKAIKEGAVLDYVNAESYYKKFVENTPFNLLDDFFRPKTPKSFWDRLYRQSEKIQIAIVEDMYAKDFKLTGIDKRHAKKEEIRARLKFV